MQVADKTEDEYSTFDFFVTMFTLSRTVYRRLAVHSLQPCDIGHEPDEAATLLFTPVHPPGFR